MKRKIKGGKKTDLLRKTLDGLSLLILREFVIKLIAILGQIALVRILAPEYFGIFAIIAFIVGIPDLFLDVGLTSAIIQKSKEPSSNELSTSFYIKQILSFILYTIIFFLAPFIVLLYPGFSSAETLMIRVLALNIFIQPYKSIIISLIERSLEYRIIPKIDISGIVIYYIISIILALRGYGVWSFVLAIIAKETIEIVVAYYFRPWRPTLYFNLSAVRSMVTFGIYIQFGIVLAFFHRSIIPAIAGLKVSPYSVGLLDWSQNVSSVPRSLTDNFGRVAFSGFSKIQNDTKLLSLSIEKSITFLNIITSFFIVIVFVLGQDIVRYVLTEKWLPALPALYWYMASVFFLASNAALGQGIVAMGKSKEILTISVFIVLLEAILAYSFIIRLGFVGVAIASFMGSVTFFLSYVAYTRIIGIVVNFQTALFRNLIVTFLSFLVFCLLNSYIPSSFLYLFLKGFLGIAIYTTFSMVFTRKEIFELYSIAKQTISKPAI